MVNYLLINQNYSLNDFGIDTNGRYIYPSYSQTI